MASSIKNLLGDLLAKAPADQSQAWHLKVISEWPQIVGTLHEHMRVEKIQGSMLIIGVFHASWLQELYLLSPMLIKTINDYLQHPYVTQIKCKAAARSKNMAMDSRAPSSTPTIENAAQPKAKLLVRRQLTSLESRTLEKVEDLELRSMLETLLYVSRGNPSCVKKK